VLRSVMVIVAGIALGVGIWVSIFTLDRRAFHTGTFSKENGKTRKCQIRIYNI